MGNTPGTPTVICAWCRQVIRPGSEQVSHGICQPCRQRFLGGHAEPGQGP